MKTLVITLPRSASENFCQLYAQQHQLAYVDEILNQRIFNKSALSGKKFIEKQIRYWRQCKNSVAKIFPFEIFKCMEDRTDHQQFIDYCKRLSAESDKVIFLYRRNTTQQVISHYISLKTDQWGVLRTLPKNFEIDLSDLQQHSLDILHNHKTVLDIKSHIGGQSVCAEDYLHNSEYRKYPSQYSNPGNYVYNLENIEQLYEQG